MTNELIEQAKLVCIHEMELSKKECELIRECLNGNLGLKPSGRQLGIRGGSEYTWTMRSLRAGIQQGLFQPITLNPDGNFHEEVDEIPYQDTLDGNKGVPNGTDEDIHNTDTLDSGDPRPKENDEG